MGELSKLPYIGVVVEQQLKKAAIRTVEELCQRGSKPVYTSNRSNCLHSPSLFIGGCYIRHSQDRIAS